MRDKFSVNLNSDGVFFTLISNEGGGVEYVHPIFICINNSRKSLILDFFVRNRMYFKIKFKT